MKRQYKGEFFGVDISEKKDSKFNICLMTEDDGHWTYIEDHTFDSIWIDDLITQLEKAKKYVNFLTNNKSYRRK
jgi:hypothetical protein